MKINSIALSIQKQIEIIKFRKIFLVIFFITININTGAPSLRLMWLYLLLYFIFHNFDQFGPASSIHINLTNLSIITKFSEQNPTSFTSPKRQIYRDFCEFKLLIVYRNRQGWVTIFKRNTAMLFSNFVNFLYEFKMRVKLAFLQ